VTYAIHKPADVTPGPLTLTFDGLEFDARTPKGSVRVKSRLVGRPNVSNILATVAVSTALGLPVAAIERGLANLDGVPGRFEVVSDARDDITVVIDYAHTDDALKNLLETARPLAQRRVITLFGCGGDRDRTKRPLMGAVASRLSDVVVITSDNPRSEDPSRIIELGSRILATRYVPPDEPAVAAAITGLHAAGADMLIIAGETSIMDRDDVTPQGIQLAGGRIEHYGAPVEPGNLLLLGYLDRQGKTIAVLGAPGCVRSRDTNIVDLLLPRLLAGESITRQDIVALGHGGLLG